MGKTISIKKTDVCDDVRFNKYMHVTNKAYFSCCLTVFDVVRKAVLNDDILSYNDIVILLRQPVCDVSL